MKLNTAIYIKTDNGFERIGDILEINNEIVTYLTYEFKKKQIHYSKLFQLQIHPVKLSD